MRCLKKEKKMEKIGEADLHCNDGSSICDPLGGTRTWRIKNTPIFTSNQFTENFFERHYFYNTTTKENANDR